MTNSQICDFYHNNVSLTLADLSDITHKPIEELKDILSKPAPVVSYSRQRGRCYNYSARKV